MAELGTLVAKGAVPVKFCVTLQTTGKSTCHNLKGPFKRSVKSVTYLISIRELHCSNGEMLSVSSCGRQMLLKLTLKKVEKSVKGCTGLTSNGKEEARNNKNISCTDVGLL